MQTSSATSTTTTPAALVSDLLTSTRFTAALHPSQTAYITSLVALCQAEAAELAVTKTVYQVHAHTVELYDVRTRARFEDEVIERIAKEWPLKHPHCGPVCPLRRGVCVGMIDNQHAIVCVGNCKFFYADTDDSLLNCGRLVLTEKANGEYTLATLCAQNKWIVVGSKNVRVCLEFDPANPQNTLQSFNEIFARDTRFSYVGQMLELWLEALNPSNPWSKSLTQELSSGMLVGEQVGVHAHIFAGYQRPSIRVFASIPFDTLTSAISPNFMAHLGARLGLAQTTLNDVVSFVQCSEFVLPRDLDKAKQALNEIASGPMTVHGEGVVAYMYTDNLRSLGLFKFKNEEYHFDRRLRTVMTPLAAELGKQGATYARLRDETERIRVEMDKARVQFSRMDMTRADFKLSLIPGLVAFLDKHQSTMFCHEFSDNFTTILEQCTARRESYLKMAALFASVSDPCMTAFEELMHKHSGLVPAVSLKTPDVAASEVYEAWVKAGGLTAHNAIGIAAGPGGGKTTILRRLLSLLESNHVPAALFDRDAYVLSLPNARPDFVHREWIRDMCDAINEGKLILVGNTFTGAFADKLSEQVPGAKVFLAAVKEHTVPVSAKRLVPNSLERRKCQDMDLRLGAAAFDLVCLDRLLRRRDPGADDSTLNITLGARVVLEKFFSSQPDEAMLKTRLSSNHAIAFRQVVGVDFPDAIGMELAKDLVKLKQEVQNMEQKRAKDRQKRGRLEAESQEDEVLPGTKTKAIHTSHKKIMVRDWTGKEDVLYVALQPRDVVGRVLFTWADPDIVRTDGHVTLAYHPDAAKMNELVPMLKQAQGMELALGRLITVTKTPSRDDALRLQFCQVVSEFMGFRGLHVTLGSTDIDALPHALCGKVLEALGGDALSGASTQTVVKVGEDVYYAHVDQVSTTVTYVGDAMCVCSSSS